MASWGSSLVALASLVEHVFQGTQGSVVAALGLSSCMRLLGSRVQAQLLRRTELVVLWHMGSSQSRDRTGVSCIGRRLLYH